MADSLFPEFGTEPKELFQKLVSFKSGDLDWEAGKAFSYVYYADSTITDILKKAYHLYFSENGLNPMAFPSLRKMEVEVVSMCISIFEGNEHSTGLMTSGGTESILMAVKSAKSFAQKTRNIERPELLLPVSAHPAFHKACAYFDIVPVMIPVGSDYRSIPSKYAEAVTDNTILMVASAPSYPQGVVDPIKDIGQVALKNNVPLHVDACVGGFVLPFIKNDHIPEFNLSVPGVTSISADIHKYGYASKGSSVLLYNKPELRKSQYYIYTDWPGGIYASPSIMGTKPGGAIAVAWTVLKYLGRKGYEGLVSKCMHITRAYMDYINSFEGIEVIGSPDMCIFSFQAKGFDIYEFGDEMQLMGWQLDRQQNPASLHMSISPIHEKVLDEFKSDFQKAYNLSKKINLSGIKKNLQIGAVKSIQKILPEKVFKKLQKSAVKGGHAVSGRSAALYGLIGDLKGSGSLDEMVLELLDQIIKPEK